MFSLKVNGIFVVLGVDSAISLEKNNPLLEEDYLPGDYSFPFTVPFNPVNDQIFKLARIISNTETFEQDYNAELYINGMLFIDGVVNVTAVIDKNYEITFASQMAKLKKAIENKKLSEFELGGVRTIGTTSQDVVDHAKMMIYADPLDFDYTFPMIYNPMFYDEENEDYVGYINYYDIDNDEFPINTINEDPDPDNKYTLVPCPYLHYLLKQIFLESGYLLRGEFMDDAEMKQLIVVSDYALDKKVKRHFVNAYTTADFVSSGQTVVFDNDSTDGGEDSDGVYDNTTGEYEVTAEGYHTVKCKFFLKNDTALAVLTWNFYHRIRLDGVDIYSNSVVYVDTFLKTWEFEYTFYCEASDIGKIIDVYYTSTYQPSSDPLNPLPFDLSVKEGSQVTISSDSQSDLNLYSNEINLQNHVPDVLATDFLVKIFKLGIKPRFEKGTNVVYLDYIENKLARTKYIDLTKYAEPNPSIEKEKHGGYTVDFAWNESDELIVDNFKDTSALTAVSDVNTEADLSTTVTPNGKTLVLNQNTIYNAKPSGGSGYTWGYHTDDNRPYVIAQGEEEYTLGFSPLLMRLRTIGGNGILLPATQRAGSSPYFENGVTENTDIRLMFYRGMKEDESTNVYPFASSTTKDYWGNTTGNYALKINGDEGIIENFIKTYLNFLVNSKLITYDANIPASIFTQIDVFNPVLIDRVFYFIKRMRVNITTTGVDKARLELFNL